MNIGPAFVADGEPAAAIEPGERALHAPAIAPELAAGVDLAPRQARDNVAFAALGAAEAMIIGFVAMQLVGAPPRPAAWPADRRDRVEHRREQAAVVDVGRAYERGGRGAVAVDHNMALRARLAAIRRVRPGSPPPFSPAPPRYRAPPGSNRCGWRRPSDSAAHGAAAPTRRPHANRASAASRSCPTRSPSLGAASPRECRS